MRKFVYRNFSMFFKKFWIASFLLFVQIAHSHSNYLFSQQKTPSTASQRNSTPLVLPTFLIECEGRGNECTSTNPDYVGTWAFEGRQGVQHHPAITSVPDLTIEQYDQNGVIIKRVDRNGNSVGMTAVYTGSVHGNLLSGTVAYEWPGHEGFPTNGTWAALIHSPGVMKKSYIPTPPPTPKWQPLPAATGGDMNGLWQWESDAPGHDYKAYVLKIQIYQVGTEIFGVVRERRDFIQPDQILLMATSSPAGYTAKVYRINPATDTFTWFPTELNVEDPEHFTTDSGRRFRRISQGSLKDMPCDPANASQFSGEEAYFRGFAYRIHHDLPAALCWNYIASVQEYGRAQASYGNMYRNGIGTPVDLQQAVYWLQKSAMNVDFYGQSALFKMFSIGEGVIPSGQRAKYWKLRADAIDEAVIHDHKTNPVPGWALTNSAPCSISRDSHVDPSSTLDRGRVAFEARVFGQAFCWFQITAAHDFGYLRARAYTYLGLMYVYGFGVEPDAPLGLLTMRLGASGGDPFAMSYLAILYKYGIGTKPDQNQAAYWFGRVQDPSTHGPRAWDIVMGRGSIIDTITNGVTGIPDQSEDTAACEDRMQRDYHFSFADAKERCSKDINPMAILSFGQASSRNTMMTPEELYPEFVSY
jgi:TPR repeat protein